MVSFRRPVLLALLLFPLMAKDPDDALRRLASRIAQSAQSPVVLLPLRNLSSLTAGQIQVLARSLEHELEQRGAHAGAGVRTSVTLAETSRGYLWIAEIAKTPEPAMI